ncbi:MAG TPA: hypothetical protein VFC05_05330 [Nitrososphaeraceae archaeon]|nr:hypothetical protein [Nitrososphaeraceae archaeon]
MELRKITFFTIEANKKDVNPVPLFSSSQLMYDINDYHILSSIPTYPHD